MIEKGRKNADFFYALEIPFMLENDYPTRSNGFCLPEHILSLNKKICLDIGHFYIASLHADFDFFENLGKICEKGLVFATHLQISVPPYTYFDKDIIRDQHNHLYLKKDLDIKKAIMMMKDSGCENFILEVVDVDEKDLKFLLAALK